MAVSLKWQEDCQDFSVETMVATCCDCVRPALKRTDRSDYRLHSLYSDQADLWCSEPARLKQNLACTGVLY
jgi:hypothetical protein